MIITGVAEQVPERLEGLVYLDAVVPADGEDSYDAEPSPQHARATDRAAAEAAGRPGFLLVDPYTDWLTSLLPNPDDPACLLPSSCPAARDLHPANPTRQPRGRRPPPHLHLLHRRQGRRGRRRHRAPRGPASVRPGLALSRATAQSPSADQRPPSQDRDTPVAHVDKKHRGCHTSPGTVIARGTCLIRPPGGVRPSGASAASAPRDSPLVAAEAARRLRRVVTSTMSRQLHPVSAGLVGGLGPSLSTETARAGRRCASDGCFA
jgi:hypothetical protein